VIVDWLFVAFFVWLLVKRWQQSRQPVGDRLGPVLGEATQYDECPICAERDCQSPRGRGETILRGGAYVVRQYHVCMNCNSRALWHRRLDMWVWTVKRNGVTE
jgi:hypothetical protein